MLLKCTLLMGNSATVHDNKRFVMSKTKHLWTSQSKVNTCTLNLRIVLQHNLH